MKKLFYLMFLLSPLFLTGCGDDGTAQAKEDGMAMTDDKNDNEDEDRRDSESRPSVPELGNAEAPVANDLSPAVPPASSTEVCGIKQSNDKILYDSGKTWTCRPYGSDSPITLVLNKRDDVTDSSYCCELVTSNSERIWNSENGYDNCDEGALARIREYSLIYGCEVEN